MKEKAEYKRDQSKAPIIILLILFLAIACLRPAHSPYSIVYAVIAIGFLTAAAYLIIYRYLSWYSYEVTEGELLFIKNIGSHDKYIMIAKLSDINGITKKADASVCRMGKIDYPIGDELVGSFTCGGKTRSFSFSPSNEMKELLKSKLEDRYIE